jgi:hypothetical protein
MSKIVDYGSLEDQESDSKANGQKEDWFKAIACNHVGDRLQFRCLAVTIERPFRYTRMSGEAALIA